MQDHSHHHVPGTDAWPRPVPTIGDTSSARARREDPSGWAFPEQDREALRRVVDARRDIRRYRPDPVPEDLLRRVLEAGHHGPSVGHSQPWRFLVVSDPTIRDRAAAMADRARLRQARDFTPDRAARLMDLKLEGLREAPLGVVVACDRRIPASGVLGRATFTDADMWSCAAAIENMWLTARALGLGMGWVTLFDPDELCALLGLPDGVETLGWLCLGWPDERPPSPGLERAAWSRRLPLQDVVLHDRWPADGEPVPPRFHAGVGVAARVPASPEGPAPGTLVGPDRERLVRATDEGDRLLSPPESLGLLDRVLNRLVAIGGSELSGGCLVMVGADHPVTTWGVSAFPTRSGRDVMEAAVAGTSIGVATARSAGLDAVVVDAGMEPGPLRGALPARPVDVRGDLARQDALSGADVDRLLAIGRRLGTEAAASGLVVLGEVGIGNTTVATALACAHLGVDPADAVGMGSGADTDMVGRKIEVIRQGLGRWSARPEATSTDPHVRVRGLLACLGGGEVVVLTGVVLGAAHAGAPVVLDGLAGSLPGLFAAQLEPAVQAYLVAGQESRERAHGAVLTELGLEPLLRLRMRAGEGVGACLAASMVLQGLQVRRMAARTQDQR